MRYVMTYVINKQNKSLTIDLLLLHSNNAHPYALIMNLERFVAHFKGIEHGAPQSICRYCFHL